ncbi:general transcription factor IIH subunit 4-like, partial [Trifolium medium]|nr:general transcription factor IIH subunit 4-like [Trifolium medium]
SLPPLAKKYVLQLLHIDGPVSAKLLAEWVLPDGLSKHKVAVDRLVQLRVFVEALDSGTLPRESMPSNITVRLPTLETLETEALAQWELMDTNAQLWYIIREYISNSEERGVDAGDLISFMLELSFHVIGE